MIGQKYIQIVNPSGLPIFPYGRAMLSPENVKFIEDNLGKVFPAKVYNDHYYIVTGYLVNIYNTIEVPRYVIKPTPIDPTSIDTIKAEIPVSKKVTIAIGNRTMTLPTRTMPKCKDSKNWYCINLNGRIFYWKSVAEANDSIEVLYDLLEGKLS